MVAAWVLKSCDLKEDKGIDSEQVQARNSLDNEDHKFPKQTIVPAWDFQTLQSFGITSSCQKVIK